MFSEEVPPLLVIECMMNVVVLGSCMLDSERFYLPYAQVADWF
jgi:hypothetical protein